MLNESKGNMYPFISHTWNPIKGICSHDCSYCYMKQFKQKPLRLDEKDLKTDLGRENFIFVGSSTDMWADDVEAEWIDRVLYECRLFGTNMYLFQSKNPRRFLEYYDRFPNKTVLGTTFETNRNVEISNAPKPWERLELMNYLYGFYPQFDRMITIEPIMGFDLVSMIAMIKPTFPKWVNIGADSKGHHLPEPSAEKIREFIVELKKFTEVKIKNNLKRLTEETKK